MDHTRKTGRTARGVARVINVFCDGVTSDSDEPLLAEIRAIPMGEKIEGQYFPLIAR